MPRGLRLRRISVVVLSLGLAATLGGFFATRALVGSARGNELADRAARTADVIQAFAGVSQNVVDVASAIAAAAGGDPDRFVQLLEPRLRDPIVSSATLVRIEDSRVVVLASAGSGEPELLPRLLPGEQKVFANAARTGNAAPVSIDTVAGERLVLFAAPGTADGRYAVGVEFRLGLLDERFALVGSNDIDYALYAGPFVSSATLISASTADLPLTGTSVVRSIEVLGSPATLVVAPRGAIEGEFLHVLQWIVLGVGLALTAALTFVVEAGRRRSEAAQEQRALEEQNVRLREVDRLKDELIATVSHELRTPLTSIMGYAELLQEGREGLTDEQRGFVDVVERNARRLLSLVNDLLFLARLESGGVPLELREIDFADVVRDCVEGVRPHAARAGLELSLAAPEPAYVVGDDQRLRQLVDNLLSNAVKFTPAGGRVGVRLALEGSSAVLEVADTGMGIPRAEQGRLFERFFRSSTAIASAIQGTGLGLVICRAIVDAHGGRISAESEEGAGSTFRVELPLAPTHAAAEERERETAGRPAR